MKFKLEREIAIVGGDELDVEVLAREGKSLRITFQGTRPFVPKSAEHQILIEDGETESDAIARSITTLLGVKVQAS